MNTTASCNEFRKPYLAPEIEQLPVDSGNSLCTSGHGGEIEPLPRAAEPRRSLVENVGTPKILSLVNRLKIVTLGCKFFCRKVAKMLCVSDYLCIFASHNLCPEMCEVIENQKVRIIFK